MGGVAEAIGGAIGGVVKDVFGGIGDVLDFVGLDSLGKEVTRWGEDAEQVIKVLSGEYHDDVKKVKEYEKIVSNKKQHLERIVQKYNWTLDEFSSRLNSLVAFEEIFHMAIKNRINDYQSKYGPEIDAMVTEYGRMVKLLEQMVLKLKSEYDFVIGLTEGAFVQRIIGSLIMIVGGLTSDMGDILSGKADSTTWKNVITAVIIAIIIVVTWGYAATAAGTAAPWLIASAVFATIGGLMTLDGMYANGAMTGAIMSSLDFLFNDVLNFDDLIGSDFEKFDKDHEDYQDMVGFVKIFIGLASLATGFVGSLYTQAANTAASTAGAAVQPVKSGWNIGTASRYGTDIGSQQTGILAAQDAAMGVVNTKSLLGGAVEIADTFGSSMLLGVKFSTYSQIYDAISMAFKVGDVVTANKQIKDIENKLKEDMDNLGEKVTSKLNKNMMKHFTDSAYFLQDQQEYIDRYVWSMTEQNMYVDPYGTTPVANIRFSPDKDTRIMSFGFEDIFDESTKAGSKGYFNNIIYG